MQNIQLPGKLNKLINNGFWPLTDVSVMRQNSYPLISDKLVQSNIYGEGCIYFFKPPFLTLKELAEKNEEIWDEVSHDLGLDPTLFLVIGDFGLGSDGILTLDYTDSSSEPSVRRLVYSEYKEESPNLSVLVCSSFTDFCTMFELSTELPFDKSKLISRQDESSSMSVEIKVEKNKYS